MIRRLLLVVLLLAPFALAGGYVTGLIRPPQEWDPRAPLDFRAEPNLMTRWKLARMRVEPESCFAAFAASGLSARRLPDRPSEEGCALVGTMRLEGESAVLSPARPVVTCPVAAAWLLFERHALQPAAEAHFGSRVSQVRHLGSYNCRNVYHRQAGRRSQHATANALDVAGFTLANGRQISLLQDWDGSDPARAFLRDARDGACRFFNVVLGPDYNAAHRNHFHLDKGLWSRCG